MSNKLPNGWKECRLGDIADINMGQSPKSENYNDFGEGLPFLQGNRTFGSRYPLIDTYCTDPKKIANEGEILFSVRAPVGDINIANRKICIGRGLASFNAKNQQNLFLFYLLHFIKGDIINSESGTVYGSVNKNDLESVPILLPPLPEQRAIASVLSSLDDKIDLLHRENKTLEAMAETLFRQWFIEEAKDEWEEVKLGDFFPVVTGKKNANFATPDGSYPFFTCSQSVLKAPSYSFDGAAILLAGNGDFNIKHYIGKFEAYQRTYVLMPYDTLYFGFLLTLMKYHLFDITKGYQGSVIDFITKPMIEDFVFFLPKRRDLIKNKLVCFNDLYRKIDVNVSQVRTLEKLRDTLLPKLMSGEVRIKY